MTGATRDDPWAPARARLCEELRQEGISDPGVLQALATVPREEFVREEDRSLAYLNGPLPIGHGQTISQPLIVGLMTTLLRLHGGERVLELGTGSGYQAAILAQLGARVFTIELEPVLAREADERLARLGYDTVQVRAGDGAFGWPEAAPFDAILITARTPLVPPRLVRQLRPGGVIVLPLEEPDGGETLVRATLETDGHLRIERFGAVAFVPLRGAVRRTPVGPDRS